MKIRSLIALVGLAISFALPTFAQQQKSHKELIVGAWLLVSVYDQTQDGVKHNPWGDAVKRQAIYTSDGHFSWMIMSANRHFRGGGEHRSSSGRKGNFILVTHGG